MKLFRSISTVFMVLGASLAMSAAAESFRFDKLSGIVGPFEGTDAKGHAFWVEKLGEVGAIPLYAYWSSEEAAPQGGLLGPGWHIPLLESRIVPVNEKVYEFVQPDGRKLGLRRGSRGLKGGRVWSGQVKDDKITLQGEVDGGERYTLLFRKGRLVQMSVEEGSFEFVYAGRRLEKINSRGRSLLTVARDAKNPSRVTFLFAGKNPVVAERTADGLAIAWPDGRRKTFERNPASEAESMKIGDVTMTWNPSTRKLLSFGAWRYTVGAVKHEWNNPPIRRVDGEGREEFYHYNLEDGSGEYRMADGTKYEWERFPSGDHYGMMRWSEKTRNGALLHRRDYVYGSSRNLVYSRYSRGEEEREGNSLPALEERWYSPDGKVRRVRLDNVEAEP